MKVLITGGGGFIGSHLVESQLNQEHFVRTIDLDAGRINHILDHPNLEIVLGDIAEEHFLEQIVSGVDTIFHLASAHLDVSLPEKRYWDVNVRGTEKILKAARSAGVKRFVHCSSVGVFGDIKNPPADETTSPKPDNVYTQTKLAGEQTALKFAEATGFPVVVARPAWVYGPRCPRTLKLIRNIQKGRFLMFGDGQTLRHPIYVSDVVHGLELCANQKDVAGQIYILAGNSPVTIAQLVETIATLVDQKPTRYHFPISLAILGGWSLEIMFKLIGRQPPFSRRSVDFFVKDNAYDISKAKRELGFIPTVDLHTGLMKVLDWYSKGNH